MRAHACASAHTCVYVVLAASRVPKGNKAEVSCGGEDSLAKAHSRVKAWLGSKVGGEGFAGCDGEVKGLGNTYRTCARLRVSLLLIGVGAHTLTFLNIPQLSHTHTHTHRCMDDH